MSNSNTQQLLSLFSETEKKQKSSLRELVIKYLSYLPLFVLCFAIAFGGALMYIRYKVPIYKASVQVLVSNAGSSNVVQQDLITQAVSGVRPINLENEMQLIRSKGLLEGVVKKGEFNITYSKEGNIKTFDAYKQSPVTLVPLKIEDSLKSYLVKIKSLNENGGKIETAKGVIDFKFNDSISFPHFSFKINKSFDNIGNITDPYVIKWRPISYAAMELQGRLSVSTLSSKTSILVLNIVGENRKKGEDILNLFVNEIIRNDVEQKQEASVNTINFIDGRLNMVEKDLKDVESDVVNKRKDSRFYDIQQAYLFYQNKLSQSEVKIDQVEDDIQIIGLIEDYVKNNKSVNKSKIIPSTLGINDPTFLAMVAKYNEAQSKKELKSLSLTPESAESIQIETELKEAKTNLLEAAANIKNERKQKIKTLNLRNNEDLQDQASLPEQEKIRKEIERQKLIKEKLYLYLLQKREETAISSVSTESNYKAMDPAGSSGVPIEPQAGQIKTFAIIVGLLFPILFIYLVDMLNDKVTTRLDITAKTDLPIVGEISHVDNPTSIVVENSRNIVAEQFRILRSNLQFVLPKQNGDKATTILITSSISGEGKSFVSLNMAAVLALTGKRVALMEFDLRKLKGIKIAEFEDLPNDRGITNFLIGQTEDLNILYKTLANLPNMHIYNTGPIPPNPAELIINQKMDKLFDLLKNNYDYVVVDSAPVGLVSDSFALSKFADVVLYIVRQRYTLKKQLDFISDLKKENKLENLALVINDVNLAGRYGYYGYGYGYGYGYMYKYGIGYGYNRYIYGGKKKDPYFDANKKGYFDDKIKVSWWQKIFGK